MCGFLEIKNKNGFDTLININKIAIVSQDTDADGNLFTCIILDDGTDFYVSESYDVIRSMIQEIVNHS